LVRGYGNEPPSRSLEYAHVNYPGLYALEATLEYLAALGWPAIHARVDALWSQLAAGLLAQGRVVVTPASAHAGIASFADTAVEDLVRMLAGAGIQVEARGSLLRVAPHFYNTAADVGAFLAALADLRPAPAPGRPSGVPA
jgi:selenocysteine lyase/cysteine desulfurase